MFSYLNVTFLMWQCSSSILCWVIFLAQFFLIVVLANLCLWVWLIFLVRKKMVLLNADWISVQGDKLQNNSFLSTCVPCRSSCYWFHEMNHCLRCSQNSRSEALMALFRCLKIRQLAGMPCSRGVLELVVSTKNKAEYIIFYKLHNSLLPCAKTTVLSLLCCLVSFPRMHDNSLHPYYQAAFFGSEETLCAHH